MLINGNDVTLDPDDFDERRQITVALTEYLKRQPICAGGSQGDHVVAALTSAAAVLFLENELRDAKSYRWLRDRIENTMPDPNDWDHDEAETAVLARYVQHLATASHGDCGNCGRRIAAGEHFEAVNNIGNPVPEGTPGSFPYCGTCP